MLRYLGVPARVAVGFSSGTYDGSKGLWRVTDHDAHAWVEAWFRGYGWLPFDPTPSGRARGRPAERAVRGRHPHGRPRAGGPRDPRSRPRRPARRGAPSRRGGSGRPRTRQTARAAARQLARRQPPRPARARRRGDRDRPRRHEARRAARALSSRATRGASRPPAGRSSPTILLDQRIDAARSATLHELGALVRHELAVDPDAFVGAATAARFGPPDGAAPAARRARRELRALLRGVRVRLPARDRVRGLLSLRSFGFAP